MSAIPEGLQYSRDHEWVRTEGDVATIGITAFAQDQLGELVFVELVPSGSHIGRSESLGVVESVKTASDVLAPLSGEVLERNAQVLSDPQHVNTAPYDDGWLIKMRPSDPAELADLLSATEYRAHIGQGGAA